MADHKALDAKAIKLARMTVQMCTEAGSGHPSSGLSLLHLVTVLMYRVMRYDPKDPWNLGSDRLVLSEGHAVPVVYAAYCDLGGVAGSRENPIELHFEDALTLRENDSVLDGHPNPAAGFPFFDAATGSLGQGLSVAAGLACGDRVGGVDRRIFCIIGDGESREGQIAEALDFIADHQLTAVCPIFNCNGLGQSDSVSPQQSPETLQAKLQACGFEVRLIDGHDWDEILAALAVPDGDKPTAIVARTIKGWGVTELQGHGHHGKPLTPEEATHAVAQLDARADQIGISHGDDEIAADIPAAGKVHHPAGAALSAGSFGQALEKVGWAGALEKRKLGTRKAYGAALAALGADERIVVLDGDVKNSTFAELFAKQYPNRYFEARIAEQNMISAGAGIAATGRIPFVSSFAKFLIRGCDQIEMACNSCANLKICGSHSGVSLAADGPSQMGLPDVAFFRSFAHASRKDGSPAIRVFLPCDAISAFKLTEQMANVDGMCFMRTHRPDVPFLYDEAEEFPFGGFKHLIDGQDIAIVASGYMVHVARQAVDLLQDKNGLEASLIDVYSLPLQTEEILRIGDDCRGQILVVEDNYIGGVYDELATAAAGSDLGISVHGMYVRHVPKSAKTPEEILKQVGLSAQDIANRAQEIFEKSEA